MKDLGNLKYFLGIEVARNKDCIMLNQRKYVLDLLAETGILDCTPVDTPIEQNHRIAELDLAYAVIVVSQYMHNPNEDHMNAVMRILRYLKSASGKDLVFRKHDYLRTSGYTDADRAWNITVLVYISDLDARPSSITLAFTLMVTPSRMLLAFEKGRRAVICSCRSCFEQTSAF
ncbi:hypothetical protein ACLB2K_042757 [Fragaria x ananassa]